MVSAFSRTVALLRSCVVALAAKGRSFPGERSAMGAVEFAILLPILITAYIGVAVITDGFTIKRKVDMATSAIGDLATRTKAISTGEMDAILDAAEAILAPYNTANLRTKLTCVVIDEDEVATVAWGESRHDTADVKDAVITLPDGVSLPDSKVVIAEAHYNFTPAIGYVISGDLDLAATFYLKPRDDNTVCYDSDCC